MQYAKGSTWCLAMIIVSYMVPTCFIALQFYRAESMGLDAWFCASTTVLTYSCNMR